MQISIDFPLRHTVVLFFSGTPLIAEHTDLGILFTIGRMRPFDFSRSGRIPQHSLISKVLPDGTEEFHTKPPGHIHSPPSRRTLASENFC